MTASPSSAALGPTPPSQRFPWIDALRGFALLGILLMNVEVFNRARGAVSSGLDPAALGVDHVVDWLIYVFVRTKFWILFSLLFGMGFALMLDRARDGDRAFLRTYLRRTLALLLFGAVHGILIWEGDILTAYAIAALFLLLAMFGRLRDGVVIAIAVALVAVVFHPFAFNLIMLLMVGLAGLYIRGDCRFRLFGREWLLMPFMMAVLGLLLMVGGVIYAILNGFDEMAIGLIAQGLAFLPLAWFTCKRREPAVRRPLQFGLAFFLMFFLVDVAMGVLTPHQEPPTETAQAQREKAQQKQDKQIALDTRVLSSGTYVEAVKLRAKPWWKGAINGTGGINYFLMFLIGLWLVRSGIAVAPSQHLRELRWLCGVGLSLGLLLSIGGALFLPLTLIAGKNEDAFQLQNDLHYLGALPLSLGYLSLVLLAWQTAAGKACLSWLAPVGRMALTNYLAQSVVCSLFFYGYGLGHWGMPRAQQAVFCVTLFAVQIVISQLWLRHFRFGPMEWVWRRLTYGRA